MQVAMATCDFLCKTLFLLMGAITFIDLVEGVRGPVQISKDVAKLICLQRSRFVKHGELEEPVKARYRPISPLRCGWYSFGTCGKGGRCSYQKYEDCAGHVKKKKVFPTRIHGGIEAVPHSHPSMVFLKVKDGLCGAVIIATNWVMTAAHCTYATHEQDIILLAGRHNLDEIDNEEFTEQRVDGVKKIYEHPKYKQNANVSHDDICLMELYEDKKFKFNQIVSSANTATASFNAKGKATLVGWGMLDDGVLTGLLHEAQMTIISDSKCKKFWGHFVQKDHICTYDKGKTGCSGDSGGPLIQIIEGKTTVIGIQSEAGPCSLSNMPSIYTEVSHYSDWILKRKKPRD